MAAALVTRDVVHFCKGEEYQVARADAEQDLVALMVVWRVTWERQQAPQRGSAGFKPTGLVDVAGNERRCLDRHVIYRAGDCARTNRPGVGAVERDKDWVGVLPRFSGAVTSCRRRTYRVGLGQAEDDPFHPLAGIVRKVNQDNEEDQRPPAGEGREQNALLEPLG